MLRIIALNEEGSDIGPDEEICLTKEAQETIAETEYMNAIKLKSRRPDLALQLLSELLETKVLHEICLNNKDDKLWAIRYNCLKNVAIIYEEKNECNLALQHYVLAIQMEDSDVYTVHRFGNLALKVGAFELAEYAFENCLRRNPLHWSAADGLLQILCRTNNILGAYGLALKLNQRHPYYERAVKTVYEIIKTFADIIPFYNIFWKDLFQNPSQILLYSTEEFHVLQTVCKTESPCKNNGIEETALSRFRIKSLSWLSIGQYITSVYFYLKREERSMLFTLRFEDMSSDTKIALIDNNPIPDNSDSNSTTISNEGCKSIRLQDITREQEINSQSSELSIFITPLLDQCNNKNHNQFFGSNINNDDSDSNAKADDISKPKPRRRCSDLHFLEQWGWHKNRRYSRKKTQPDRTEIDMTLNGFLRRIFCKFTSTIFEDTWPFLNIDDNDNKENSTETVMECTICNRSTLAENLDENFKENFDAFLNQLKEKPFDLMVLINSWLTYISLFWNKPWPDELKVKYLDIFNLYLEHIDLSIWNQTSQDFETSFRICLLYLELEYVKELNENGEISTQWRNILLRLMHETGQCFLELETYEIYRIRLANLEYLMYSSTNDLENCVLCLENIEQMFRNQHDAFVLHIPNSYTGCQVQRNVNKTRNELQRRIALWEIPNLYKERKWDVLIDTIKINIRHSKNLSENENWCNDFKVQLEILLESFWNKKDYENCIIWAEKFLHYASHQHLREVKKPLQQKLWLDALNFIFSYIETLILNEGYDIVMHLDKTLDRLVQNIIRILSFHLDEPLDKTTYYVHELEMKRPWVILHQIILREENGNPIVVKSKISDSEDDDDLIPNTFLVLFTAHEFLGKRQMCAKNNGEFLFYILDAVVPNLRAPLYDVCRDAVYEYIEQVTYCLYGYPQKKARSRHLEDHEASPIIFTWSKAIQIFDLYRPEQLPEFNSYKLESISADMEQLLLKIVSIIPQQYDPSAATVEILKLINGETDIELEDFSYIQLPYKINSIYYLLADYYFKNRDFSKTVKYYMLDLAFNPNRFDSWAGLALSKASNVDTKINSLVSVSLTNLLLESENTIRCYERCIMLNRHQTLLWIEYGSFAYTIHAYCSRYLKHSSDQLSIDQFSIVEIRKEKMLKISYNCFSLAANLQNITIESGDESNESHDEKWLCQYMLGKIAEKRKDPPKIFLNHFLKAANSLYESNATYPIKINHGNPTTLSVEALEIFYRTNSSIIKYLEHQREVSRANGDLFSSVLVNLSRSPFAYNKAKIDGNSLNAFKRKLADKVDQTYQAKIFKSNKKNNENIILPAEPNNLLPETSIIINEQDIIAEVNIADKIKSSKNKIYEHETKDVKDPKNLIKKSSSRRDSQESVATGTTTTITSSTTSSSTSSDSSSSESDSDSNISYNYARKDDNTSTYTAKELDNLYKVVIRNLEECVSRFPEHYKSLYRLVYHYMNGPLNLCNFNRCEELLLGQYKTNLGNQINGLFYDRKNNNIFNGIWRIPSSEIDRPGSFSAHLVKCVSILIQLLMKMSNYKLLVEVGLQLYKTPDQDKRYIKDDDRLELFQQSINYSAQILRNTIKTIMEKRDDTTTLNLLIDIYKIHKKCLKYMNHKEPVFTQLLIDVYKFYIKDKVDYIPDNPNFLDLAIKLCLQEMSFHKNLAKAKNTDESQLLVSHDLQSPYFNVNRHIPGLSIRGRVRTNTNKTSVSSSFGNTSNMSFKSISETPSTSFTFNADSLQTPNLMSMITLLGTSPVIQKDSTGFQRLVAEYYKQIISDGQKAGAVCSILPTLEPSFSSDMATPQSKFNAIADAIKTNPDSKSIMDLAPSHKSQFNFELKDTLFEQRSLAPHMEHAKQDEIRTDVASYYSLSNSDNRPNSIANLQVSETPQQSINERQSLNTLDWKSNINSMEIYTNQSCSKFQGKVNNLDSNVEETCKPYNRPSAQNNFAHLTMNKDSCNNQINFLETYADLYKNVSGQQENPFIPQKSRASAKRKTKAPLTRDGDAVTSIKYPDNFNLHSNQPPLSLSNQSNYTPVEIIQTKVPQLLNIETGCFADTTILPNLTFSTETSLSTSTSFSQQHSITFPTQISPTKTLQQKLAERQKANQINDTKLPACADVDEKPRVDVIILD